MLKKDKNVIVAKGLAQQFDQSGFDKCCQLALQQPLPNQQIAAAGYAILIDEDCNQEDTSLKKLYAPVAYGSKIFTRTLIEMSRQAKEFLAV